jgi:CheY-like chemotaxis protein
MKKLALVVDDNALVLSVVADTLEEMGLQTYRARDGTEAVAILRSPLPIDVVVTDVVMHEVSGVDVFRAARNRSPHLPVVFVTGYSADLLQDIRPDALTKVVDKPFTIEQFSAALRAVMAA